MELSDFYVAPTSRRVVSFMGGAASGAIVATALQYAIGVDLLTFIGLAAFAGAVAGLAVKQHQIRKGAPGETVKRALPRSGKLTAIGLACFVLICACVGLIRASLTDTPHSWVFVGIVAALAALLTGYAVAYIATRDYKR